MIPVTEIMRTLRFVTIAVACAYGVCVACRPPFPLHAGTVRLVSGEIPPTFEFKSKLDLTYISFVEAHSVGLPGTDSKDAKDLGTEVWRISPPGRRFIPADDTPAITYGQLAPKWEQEIPKNGLAPALKDEAVYYVDAELNEGRRINMCILIRNNKAEVYHGKLDHLDCDKE